MGGDIIHEEGEGADTESYAVNWKKILADLPAGGIHGKVGDMVRIEDFSQNLEVDVCVWHREEWDEEKESDGFVIGGGDKLFQVKKEESEGKKKETKNANEANDNSNDDDDIICMEDGVECISPPTNKTETDLETKSEDDGKNGKKRQRSEVNIDAIVDNSKK